jgi:hypothetical protein
MRKEEEQNAKRRESGETSHVILRATPISCSSQPPPKARTFCVYNISITDLRRF